MADRPLIGVTANGLTIDGLYSAQVSGDKTLRAVIETGCGIPLVIPGMGDAAETGEWFALLDGLVLTGGRPNVHPSEYGEEDDGRHGPFDRGRDGVMLPLIRAMVEAGKPVLGICRGIQEMNVAFGGTLHPEIRDEPGRMNHRMPKGETDETVIFAPRHRVRFREGGALHRILGVTQAMTNSLHGQAVWTPGPRVTVEGEAADGTIEAIAIADAPGFAIGVQWHAEYGIAGDPVNAALFRDFRKAVHAARDQSN